jgi:Reverse transcriptase (RNA-dependent DNA polymerase)
LLWVFKYKFDTDGYLTKFKARLCVQGDLQSTEQDTYAATLAARTFRALIAIAAAFDLEIQQYDAVNAFVNSKLNEDIYCYSPEGFKRQNSC